MTFRFVRLGDVCSTTSGGTPLRTHHEYYDGDIPWIKSGDLNDGIVTECSERITQAGLSNSSAKLFPVGTLLIAMYGATVGKLGILGINAATNQAVCGIMVPNELLREYLFYYLLSQRSQLIDMSTGGAQPNISQKIIRELSIPLPSLTEQQRIVDILSRAEGIVRLRREAQQKAAEIIPALFLDTFGDPATNPKGWPLRPFSELGSLDRGRSRHRPRDAEELYGGPYPFIQTGDVSNSGGLITRYSSTYSEAGLAQSKLWKKGTLCITIAANIAQTGVLGFDACFPDSVVGFLGGDEVSTEYIQVWLSFLQPALEAYAPQVAQKNINLDILRKLPVMSPPLALQQDFSHRCRDVLSLRLQQNRSLTVAQATFDALLAQSFAPPTAQQAAA